MPRYKIQAGVMVYGNGPLAIRYLSEIIAEEEKHINTEYSERDGYGSPHWFLSQTLLYTKYKDIRGLKITQLPTKFNDCKFNDESVIWHCKSSHFNDPKFQKEFKHYATSKH